MKTKSVMMIIIGCVMFGCATQIEQYPQPSNITPKKSLTRTETMKQDAQSVHADVIARNDYNEGIEFYNEAIESERESENKEAISNSAYAQAYFKRATDKAIKTKKDYPNVFSARKEALHEGASYYEDIKTSLKEIDDDLVFKSDSFTKELKPEEIAQFQNRYLKTEVLALQESNLGTVGRTLDRLEGEGADDLATSTYTQARKSYLLAKNKIADNTSDQSHYIDLVNQARTDVIMLYDVMSVIKKNGEDTPEMAAIKIVNQERKLGRLKTDMLVLNSVVDAQKSAMITQTDKVAFQNAMDNVRKNFSKDEAEVYQQGNELIIRLKKMNFDVGKAEIPKESKNLLNKVATVVEDISPTKISVQGHTDTTGSKEINEKLSQKRAENVASFLKGNGINATIDSMGFGPNKPLADNQTAQGRALNRRVDLVVTAKNM